MILSDFHLHTTFSDGKNTPEQMVQKALELGLNKMGFSDHSPTFFDKSYCIKKENLNLYRETINDLKHKYADKIKIYCGIEQDFYSDEKTDDYDYVIGSVHYVKVSKDYIAVDESADSFKAAVSKYFDGDALSFAEAYFETVKRVLEKTNADIIGHFDLISKFNDQGLFDESDKRYIAAWKGAADELLKYKKTFEINTGAISRGYKKEPYPSKDILNYLKDNGAKFVLSSDAHSTDAICFNFDKLKDLTIR
jgi:histidinol-phosphatase (PHP family)